MTIDFTALIKKSQQVKQELDSSGSGGGGSRYPYPTTFIKPDPKATLKVRILPNIHTNMIVVKYGQHKLADGSTSLCGHSMSEGSHNSYCPLCSAVSELKNSRGIEAKQSYKGRSMMLAQYVDDTGYVWTEQYPKPQKGQIIIVMGPTGLYNEVYSAVASSAEAATKMLQDPNGAVVIIGRSSDLRMKVTLTYETINSAQTQEQYNELLLSLPNLLELPKLNISTQEAMAILEKEAQTIRNTLIVDRPVQVVNTPIDSMVEQVATYPQPPQPAPSDYNPAWGGGVSQVQQSPYTPQPSVQQPFQQPQYTPQQPSVQQPVHQSQVAHTPQVPFQQQSVNPGVPQDVVFPEPPVVQQQPQNNQWSNTGQNTPVSFDGNHWK